MDSNREQKFVFKQPQDLDQRKELAKILVDRLKYRVPLAIDAMDNRTDKAFAAWPERIYILGEGGKILYKGGPGPFGFKPDEAERRGGSRARRPEDVDPADPSGRRFQPPSTDRPPRVVARSSRAAPRSSGTPRARRTDSASCRGREAGPARPASRSGCPSPC